MILSWLKYNGKKVIITDSDYSDIINVKIKTFDTEFLQQSNVYENNMVNCFLILFIPRIRRYV